jgi:hypothetical protein
VKGFSASRAGEDALEAAGAATGGTGMAERTNGASTGANNGNRRRSGTPSTTPAAAARESAVVRARETQRPCQRDGASVGLHSFTALLPHRARECRICTTAYSPCQRRPPPEAAPRRHPS